MKRVPHAHIIYSVCSIFLVKGVVPANLSFEQGKIMYFAIMFCFPVKMHLFAFFTYRFLEMPLSAAAFAL
jgi:hypothetical protein